MRRRGQGSKETKSQEKQKRIIIGSKAREHVRKAWYAMQNTS